MNLAVHRDLEGSCHVLMSAISETEYRLVLLAPSAMSTVVYQHVQKTLAAVLCSSCSFELGSIFMVSRAHNTILVKKRPTCMRQYYP